MWNIHQLEAKLPEDLAMCRTPHEILICKTVHGIGVRKMAEHLAAQGKLTPAQKAIAEKYGYAS